MSSFNAVFKLYSLQRKGYSHLITEPDDNNKINSISCFLFTILALFFTWWYSMSMSKGEKNGHKGINRGAKSSKKTQDGFNKTSMVSPVEENISHRKTERTIMQDAPNPLTEKDTSMMSHIKTIRQTEIEKQLTAGLSEQQLLDEKKMQASQLEAIYKLLKEKEDKFQIRSMDELQDQLRLYKRTK